MSDLSDFSDEDKAKLLELADRRSLKLYHMSFNALLEKLSSSGKSIDKQMLFTSMVFAGYLDITKPDASTQDPNAANLKDSDAAAS